jgi:hypothetical protein
MFATAIVHAIFQINGHPYLAMATNELFNLKPTALHCKEEYDLAILTGPVANALGLNQQPASDPGYGKTVADVAQ